MLSKRAISGTPPEKAVTIKLILAASPVIFTIPTTIPAVAHAKLIVIIALADFSRSLIS